MKHAWRKAFQPTHSQHIPLENTHIHKSHYQSTQTTHSNLTCTWLHLEISNRTVDGEKKPAPADMVNITAFKGLYNGLYITSQLLQDFFRQQYIGHIGAPWHALGTPAAACSAMRTSSFALPKPRHGIQHWNRPRPSHANHLGGAQTSTTLSIVRTIYHSGPHSWNPGVNR